MAAEAWDSGQAYEQYVGRWSRVVAAEFLHWLARPRGLAWADVGCGTGALTSAILSMCEPASVRGIDSSTAFVTQARQRLRMPQVLFETGDATRLPWSSGVSDVTVSGLVLREADGTIIVQDPIAHLRGAGGARALVQDLLDRCATAEARA